MFTKMLKCHLPLLLPGVEVVRREGTSGDLAPLFCVFCSLISVVRNMTFVLDQRMGDMIFYLFPI